MQTQNGRRRKYFNQKVNSQVILYPPITCILFAKKELSLCHKLWFYSPDICSTKRRRSEIFQTMNSVRSNNLSLKYQRVIPPDWKDIGVRKFEFVVKTQFLCKFNFLQNCDQNNNSSQLTMLTQIYIFQINT